MHEDAPQQDLEELRREVRRLADRAEIAELGSRLGRTLDEKRFEDFPSIFAPDVTAKFPGAAIEGSETLAEMGRKNLASFERVHHVITNFIIELDGDRATARANLTATHIHRADEPMGHFDTGCVYEFGVVRTAAGWRFSHIELRHVWSSGSVADEVLDRLSPATNGAASTTTPKALLAELDVQLKADPSRTDGVEARYAFVLDGDGGGEWWVEARSGTGAVHEGRPDEATVTIHMSDDVFVRLGTGELDGAQAYFNGDLSAEGDESKLIFLEQIFGG